MVILSMAFFLLSAPIIPCSQCENIADYLELELVYWQDTVNFGENVKIDVVFKNTTGHELSFYPKSIIFLAKPMAGFEFNSLFLNRALDVAKRKDIGPGMVYSETYEIGITEDFFSKGPNVLILGYTCKKLKGKLKKHNTLCGNLVTEESILFITR